MGCETCVRNGFCTLQKEQARLAKQLAPYAQAPQYKNHFRIFIECTEKVDGAVSKAAVGV